MRQIKAEVLNMKRLNVEEIKQFADALGFTESESKFEG